MAFGQNYGYNPWTQYQTANYYQQQPVMQQPVQQPIQQPQQNIPQNSTQDDRIWVSSPSAAESYMLPANSFIRLWDSTQPCFYEKQTDAQGKPFPVQVYDYKLRSATPIQPTVPDYGDKFSDYDSRIAELDKRIAELENRKPKKEEQK